MNKYKETFGVDISKPACRQAGMSMMFMVVNVVILSLRMMSMNLNYLSRP